MKTHNISLNADIGESFGAWTMGADELIMPHIDWANIACGFHASDPLTMLQTVRLATQHEVRLGAHPSYPDLVGFGRRHMDCKPAEVTAMVQYQVGALRGIAQSAHASVDYVKPHGALYNDMLADEAVFLAVCEAIKALQNNTQSELPLMVMATPDNDYWRQRAEAYEVTLVFEGFADRAYDDNGRLRARKHPDAVLSSPEQLLSQARQFARGEAITSVSGKPLDITIDSLCVHGDNPKSIEIVKQIREVLNNEC